MSISLWSHGYVIGDKMYLKNGILIEKAIIRPKQGECDLCSTYTWTHNTEFEGEELWLCNICKEDLFYNEKR